MKYETRRVDQKLGDDEYSNYHHRNFSLSSPVRAVELKMLFLPFNLAPLYGSTDQYISNWTMHFEKSHMRKEGGGRGSEKSHDILSGGGGSKNRENHLT